LLSRFPPYLGPWTIDPQQSAAPGGQLILFFKEAIMLLEGLCQAEFVPNE
jgi:hypothetical protein